MSPCPTPDRLRTILEDGSPKADEAEVAAHVEGCPDCQRLLERLTSLQTTRHSPPGSRISYPPGGFPPGDGKPRFSDTQLDRLRVLLPDRHRLVAAEPVDSVPRPETKDLPSIPGYEVFGVLGRGGMAIVYEALHLRLNRPVALKMMRSVDYATSEQLVRFCAEGEMIARLKHPNIVQIYEVGSHDRRPYFALELMEGGSLDVAQGGRPIPPREAGQLIETLARAMDYAHERGVVHRDLKPANVLLSVGPKGERLGGVPKISDFGLAKNVGTESGLTQVGSVMGTPSYMAPEQVRGMAGKTGPSSDVYSLGAILYELLTGRPPFLAATSLEILNQVTDLDPVPPSRLLPQIPRDLGVICLKCLEKEPEKRYPGAASLADDLGRFLRGEPIQAHPLNGLERGWRWACRRPAIAGLLVALASTLAAGMGGSTYFAVQSARRAELAVSRGDDAERASASARLAEARSARLSADLLLDRALALSEKGDVVESLHWMLASLRASPDPAFRTIVRTHLRSWGGRVPTLTHWLDTIHRSAAFAPDGRTIATAGYDDSPGDQRRVSLQSWSLTDGRPLGKPVRGEDLSLAAIAFAPDGRTLLTCNGTIQQYQHLPGWVTRWDLVDGRVGGKLVGHSGPVTCVAWTPDGRRFLSGSWDRTVRLRDASDGRELGKPWEFTDAIISLSLTPDGRRVLVSTRSSVHVVDVESGEKLGPPVAEGNIVSAAFADGGRLFCVGTEVGRSEEYRLQVRRWDDSTDSSPGEVTSSLHPTGLCISLPDGRLASLKIISPDGRWFGHFDDGLQVWRLPRDLSLPAEDSILTPPNFERERSQSRAILDPDGSTVWSTFDSTKVIRAWDVAKDRPSSIYLRHDPNPTQLVVSASGLIATIPDNHGVEPVEVQVKNKWTGEAVCPPIAQGNRVLGMAFSSDGKLLATGGLIHAAGLWEMPSGRRSGAPLPTHNIILDLEFSPDGRSLAAGCWEGQLYVWDVGSRTLRFPPLAHGEHLARVLFSPDGAVLIASTASAAHLWDARTGRKLHTLRFHRPAAVGHLFRDVQQLLSPDGSILLTSSGSGSFQLWQVADGKPLGPPSPSGKAEWACFAFSPDGRIVASGHEDGSTRLWDVATSRPIAAATKQSCPVVSVIFSPDGREYSTFALNRTVRRWSIPTPLEQDVDRIATSVMLATGRRMDATAGVIPLTRIEWEDLRRDWIRAEPNADWSISAPIQDVDWHDARAHDAEQTGHHRTALWHLDRLVEARSNDWQALLRRSRIRALEGRKGEAEADYRSASSLMTPETVESYWNYHQTEARPAGSR